MLAPFVPNPLDSGDALHATRRGETSMKSKRSMPRRRFLGTAAALGVGAELAPWPALARISPRSSQDARVTPEMVRFRPEIEPIVRMIEETPRDRVIAIAVDRLKAGLSYKELLAGLFLAGIRNIQPRPVGFKFHAVMVMNSAHELAIAAPPQDRLLPLFWAFDNFKSSQAQDVKEGDWALAPPSNQLPKPGQAREEFFRAMERWDTEGADRAVSSLVRSLGSAAAMEPLWRMAVRDQRDIGHKAIFAAQSWRTLQTIGWAHAEPVLRSVAYALLDLGGMGGASPQPVGPYQANLETASKLGPDWMMGKDDAGATKGMLETLRHATPEAASAEAARMLNRGVSPGSIWDSVMLSASELLMNSPGIIALHATTASNSLHYIYNSCGDDTTRKLALLQAVGWQPMYRDRTKPTNPVAIDSLEPAGHGPTPGDDAVAAIFEAVSSDRKKAGGLALDYVARGGSTGQVFAAARSLIFRKGRDSHDYKYAAALCEEAIASTDRAWQAPMIAAAMSQFPGSKTPDSPLIIQAREALSRLV